ncbi:MAG: hypothetical protein ABW252_08540 [Polyangiales bacterium]
MRKFLILMSLATGLMACADGEESSARGQQGLNQEATAPVKPVIENLGATCAVDADCKGTGTRCLLKSQISGLTYAGGFCTAGCANDAECGEKGWCPLAALDAGIFPSPEVQKGVTICLLKCEADADCREGYVCSSESSLTFVPPSENPQKYCRPPVPAK